MEDLEEKIEKFIYNGYGGGYGCGYNDGSGDGHGGGFGDGYGFGNDTGYGYGLGHISGYGSGTSYASGAGHVSGAGVGSGYGDGTGCGTGDGNGFSGDYDDTWLGGNSDNLCIKKLNNSNACLIDGVNTIILHVKDNIAKGEIINKDLSTTPCYIVKGNGYFAHGKTIKEAQASLVEKYMKDMNEDDVIDEFIHTFEKNKKYKCSEFFKWHNYLTGSCEMGRKSFMENHEIKMSDEFTVDEFIDLTINDYGRTVIEHLKTKWSEKG